MLLNVKMIFIGRAICCDLRFVRFRRLLARFECDTLLKSTREAFERMYSGRIDWASSASVHLFKGPRFLIGHRHDSLGRSACCA